MENDTNLSTKRKSVDWGVVIFIASVILFIFEKIALKVSVALQSPPLAFLATLGCFVIDLGLVVGAIIIIAMARRLARPPAVWGVAIALLWGIIRLLVIIAVVVK